MMPPQTQTLPYNGHGGHFVEENRRDPLDQPVTLTYIVTMNIINTITQLCIGGVVINAVVMSNFMSYRDAQHIYLCVTGYMILMSQAILTLQPHAGWASTLMYPQKKRIHWIMQIMGSLLAIIGSGMQLADGLHPNFLTAHGILGFITMLLTVLSLVAGVINLKFQKQAYAKLFNTYHGCLGAFTIAMAYISACVAFNAYQRTSFGGLTASIGIILAVGALAGILIASFSRTITRWFKF